MRSLLSVPKLYDLAQFVMRGTKYRSRLTSQFIRASSGSRILDIGCGTGTILDSLPEVEYVGLDMSAAYVAAARKRYGTKENGAPRHRSQCAFHCLELTDKTVDPLGKFDIVLAMGVVHHLDDASAMNLFAYSRQALREGGRMLTLDGVYTENQSRIVKSLLRADRGKYVREESAYRSLCSGSFTSVQTTIAHDLFRIPYTCLIMECFA